MTHTHTDKGIKMCGRKICSLDYADDIVLVDTTLNITTSRVTVTSQGGLVDTDMVINVTKTETMNVCEQGEVTVTTATQVKKVCKITCKNPGHKKVFFNVHGVKCHQDKWQM